MCYRGPPKTHSKVRPDGRQENDVSNIIDINAIRWKTDDYEDAYVDTGEIEQHLVKVADYVSLKGSESETATASSESSYIGAYEYAPGGWITDHTHADAEQWYYILSGTGLMKVGDEERIAGVGHVVFVPRNAVHSYKVVGDKPLRLLNVAIFLSK